MNATVTPAMLAQVVVSGLLAGALYAMVALGLALIFGVMRIINIAHGPLLMLGAYTTFFMYERLGVSDLRAIEYVGGSWVWGPIAFAKTRVIAALFAAAITAGAFLFLQKTRLGKAIRATSQSREVAMVCGIDVGAIHRITFGLASALAAAGGALIAMIVAIQPEMGQLWTFKSFLVIVLGGAGNYPGALLGGLLLGLVEQVASLFLTTQLSEVVAYVLLVAVLLIRPTGLLGGRQT